MICKIADLVVKFKNPSQACRDFLKDYSFDGIPQIEFSITEQDIENIRSVITYNASDLQFELTAFYNKFLEQLPFYNAMFLHASLIDVKGIGVAFTALSGTGKSTHTMLWQEFLGDKMKIINGDKPIIRFKDDIPYGYGTPWNGKERLGINSKVPVKHICFIEQSDKNSCEKITAQKSLERIFSQIFIPTDAIAASKTLELLNRLLNCCTIWNIKCNMDIEAAQIAYHTIFEENKYEA